MKELWIFLSKKGKAVDNPRFFHWTAVEKPVDNVNNCPKTDVRISVMA